MAQRRIRLQPNCLHTAGINATIISTNNMYCCSLVCVQRQTYTEATSLKWHHVTEAIPRHWTNKTLVRARNYPNKQILGQMIHHVNQNGLGPIPALIGSYWRVTYDLQCNLLWCWAQQERTRGGYNGLESIGMARNRKKNVEKRCLSCKYWKHSEISFIVRFILSNL